MPYSLSVTEGSSYNLSASDTSSSLSLSLTGPAGPSGPAGPAGPAGTGGGDHGALTGLGDDDHPQYHNNARGDARYITINGNAGTPSAIVLTNATGNASALSVNFAVTSLYANDAGMAGGVARSGITTALLSDPLPILSGGTGASSAGAARTALGSKAIGDALFQSETEANALEVLGKRLKIKSASTTRTSAGTGSTYTVDSDFTIAVVAGGVYTVQFVFYHTCTVNSGFKGRFKIPSVPTVLVAAHYGAGFLTQTGGSTTYVDQQTSGYIGAEKISRTTAATAGSIGGQFEVQIGTSGGDLTFEWAQNASHADASTLLLGSRIIITRHY